MDWQTALPKFLERHRGKLSWKEIGVMTEYKEDNVSIPGLWSWRGKIWKKYEGRYPTQEELSMEPDHVFFDPDFICYCRHINSSGEVTKEEWFHHGRRITPASRLWDKRPVA